MCTEKKKSPNGNLLIQLPVCAQEAAGAPGRSSGAAAPLCGMDFLLPGEECGRVLSSLCSPVCLVQNITF